MGFVAQAAGGAVAVYFLSLLCGLLFKTQEPTERALFAAIAGLIISSVLAGFGMADGGSFRFDAVVIYIPGAVLAYFLLKRRYEKLFEDEHSQLNNSAPAEAQTIERGYGRPEVQDDQPTQ